MRAGYQSKEALWGVRNIIEGLRDLAKMSEAQPAKIAFLSGLALFRYVGIEEYLDFRDEVLAMVDAEPDAARPFAMAAPFVYHLYEMRSRLEAETSRLERGASPAYQTWLERLKGALRVEPSGVAQAGTVTTLHSSRRGRSVCPSPA